MHRTTTAQGTSEGSASAKGSRTRMINHRAAVAVTPPAKQRPQRMHHEQSWVSMTLYERIAFFAQELVENPVASEATTYDDLNLRPVTPSSPFTVSSRLELGSDLKQLSSPQVPSPSSASDVSQQSSYSRQDTPENVQEKQPSVVPIASPIETSSEANEYTVATATQKKLRREALEFLTADMIVAGADRNVFSKENAFVSKQEKSILKAVISPCNEDKAETSPLGPWQECGPQKPSIDPLRLLLEDEDCKELPDALRLILQEEKELLTDFLYHLLRQLHVVDFAEADRNSGRRGAKEIPLGFLGLACVHCDKKRYFCCKPGDSGSLVSPFRDHILGGHCKQCPVYVRDGLTMLQRSHSRQRKQLSPGSQSLFFHRLWKELNPSNVISHGEGVASQSDGDAMNARDSTKEEPPSSHLLCVSGPRKRKKKVILSDSGRDSDDQSDFHGQQSLNVAGVPAGPDDNNPSPPQKRPRGVQQPEERHEEPMEQHAMLENDGNASSTEEWDDEESTMLHFLEGNRKILTDYQYHIMCQLNVVRFSEEARDRGMGGSFRQYIPIGFRGLGCIHCKEKQFFYRNTSKSGTILFDIKKHILACRECPADIKDCLTQYTQSHDQQRAHLPKGSGTIFFERLWRRLRNDTKVDAGNSGPPLTIPRRRKRKSIAKGDPPRRRRRVETGDEVSVDNASAPKSGQLHAQQINVETVESRQTTKILQEESASYLLFLDQSKHLITDYVYNLLKQLRIVSFTEADKGGGRQNIPLGHRGFMCVHCSNRKFFHTNGDPVRFLKKLADHLLEGQCAPCPDAIKNSLTRLKGAHTVQKKRRPKGAKTEFLLQLFHQINDGAVLGDGEVTLNADGMNDGSEGADERAGDDEPVLDDGSTSLHIDDEEFAGDAGTDDGVNLLILLLQQGKDMLTDYSYNLMTQLKVVYFSETDQCARGRKQKPLGYPGLACRHCEDKKFFYSNPKDPGTILNRLKEHVPRCKNIPQDIKDKLTLLSKSHEEQRTRLATGSTALYFHNFWPRLFARSGHDRSMNINRKDDGGKDADDGHKSSAKKRKTSTGNARKSASFAKGVWLDHEKAGFLRGLEEYGFGSWKDYRSLVPTRSYTQIKNFGRKVEKKFGASGLTQEMRLWLSTGDSDDADLNAEEDQDDQNDQSGQNDEDDSSDDDEHSDRDSDEQSAVVAKEDLRSVSSGGDQYEQYCHWPQPVSNSDEYEVQCDEQGMNVNGDEVQSDSDSTLKEKHSDEEPCDDSDERAAPSDEKARENGVGDHEEPIANISEPRTDDCWP